MKTRFLGVLMAMLLGPGLQPATAAEFLAGNGLVVVPAADGSFLVPYRGESAASAFWCAAGEYARARLGAGPGDRIHRLTAVPRRAGEPMRFASGRGPGTGRTGLGMLGPDDGSLTVNHAIELCNRMLSP